MTDGNPKRIGAPAVLPVTLAELKAQARVDENAEDALLVGYIRAATEYVEQYTGLSLITSTWTQTCSAWPTARQPDLILLRRPLQSVTSISYMSGVGSPAGEAALLDPSIYRVVGANQDMVSARVRLGYGQVWPVALTDDEAITVTYIAGFGDDHNSVPELIRHALLMTAATWFGYRENVIMGSSVTELPFAARTLLRPWRPLAVA